MITTFDKLKNAENELEYYKIFHGYAMSVFQAITSDEAFAELVDGVGDEPKWYESSKILARFGDREDPNGR